jgi:four helix bundle protein
MDAALGHEKLDVYRLELTFVEWITDLLPELSLSSKAHRGELLEQLDRACLSALLNTAEGNSKRNGRQRAKFFDDARGSAFECAACLDAAVAKRFVAKPRIRSGKEILVRIVSILSKLIDRYDSDDGRIRNSC